MKKTIAEDLKNDPRIQEAKKLIDEAIREHSSKITTVKPADKDLQDSYEKLVAQTSDLRGGKLFYNYLGSGIGHGPLVELADGSVKYDFITGIGVHYMGHSHPEIIQAQVSGALSNTVMNGHLQQNVDTTKLLDLLSSQACKNGANVKHVFLSTSGAMANENAFKLIFQKRFPAKRFFAFEKCFAGRTLGMAYVTDKAAYRQGLPKTIDVDYIPFYDEQNHEKSIKAAVQKMEEQITRFPGEHAGFVMELIQGENGTWVGNKEYFEAIIKVCRQNNISIFFDEVQTFGRTSELFAFQYFQLDQYADVVAIGKNSQVCATFFNEEHKAKPGLMSQTFTGATTQIHASYAIIKAILEGGYLGQNGKIQKLHQCFRSHLEKMNQQYPDKIKGPFGIGGMVAMTLFNGDVEKTKEFTFKLFENGVMSFMAGSHPRARVRFLLPILATEEHHIHEVCSIIEKTLKDF